MRVLLSIRHSLGLSQRKIALRIYHESGHSITRGYLSLIERGKAKPPPWLLTWVQQYTTKPIIVSIPVCPSCSGIHIVKDCQGKLGILQWKRQRKPHYRDLFAMPPEILAWKIHNRESV